MIRNFTTTAAAAINKNNKVVVLSFFGWSIWRRYQSITHTSNGHVCMVDISHKAPTLRIAKAACKVHLGKRVVDAVFEDNFSLSKGPVLLTAEIAGIQAAKKTAYLIPLCHPLPLTNVSVKCTLDLKTASVEIISEVRCTQATGVEMEALTATTVAALTIYDMCKSASKDIVLNEIKLISKTGGKSTTETIENNINAS